MSQNIAANIPSTKQTVAGIENAQEYLADRAQQGGSGAQATVADINQALKDAKNLVQEKDLADSVRKLTNDAAAVGGQAAQKAPSSQQIGGAANDPKSTVAKAKEGAASGVNASINQASRDAHEAANQIRRIAQLTVTSPAFRRFLWNYYTLARDTFGPQIDKALEQRLNEGRKDDVTKSAEQKAAQYKQAGDQQVQQAQAKKNEASATAGSIAQAAQSGDGQGAIAGARDKAQHYSQQAKQKLDQQLPPEKRQELIQRWKSLQREVQEDPNLRVALEDLKAVIQRIRADVQPVIDQANQKAGEIKRAANEKAQQLNEKASDAKESGQQADTSGIQQVLQDARELIQKFADGKDLSPLVNAVKEWAVAIQNDQQLRQWANNLYTFVVDTKRDVNKVNDDQHLQHLNQLIDEGRGLTQGQHRDIAGRLLDESREYLHALRNDAASNRLRRSLNNVVQDLFIDNSGKFVVKPDVYKQLGNALAPSFRDIFKDIRIAHVEEHNDDMDFALDNIVIDASDIQPNQLDVTSIADISLGKQDTGAGLRFRISAKGITPKIKNTYFRYERHTFPKLSDFGSLDAALVGDGLSFNIDIEFCVAAKDNTTDRTFRANDVTVSLKGLKLDFHNAQHETLYKIFKPLIINRVTKQAEKGIKEQLYSYIDQFDDAATDARYRAAQAVEQTAGDRVVRGVDDNVGHTGYGSSGFRQTASSRTIASAY